MTQAEVDAILNSQSVCRQCRKPFLKKHWSEKICSEECRAQRQILRGLPSDDTIGVHDDIEDLGFPLYPQP